MGQTTMTTTSDQDQEEEPFHFDPTALYVQGMNVLCAPLLYVMPEPDAFWTFVKLSELIPRYMQVRVILFYLSVILLIVGSLSPRYLTPLPLPHSPYTLLSSSDLPICLLLPSLILMVVNMAVVFSTSYCVCVILNLARHCNDNDYLRSSLPLPRCSLLGPRYPRWWRCFVSGMSYLPLDFI